MMTRVKLPWFHVSIAVIAAVLICCTALPVWAQTTSMGTMTGVVTDPSGAVVPDATVTIKDKSTGDVRTTSTNSSGRYVLINLPSGTYEVTISKAGFAKVSIPSDKIEIGMVSTNNV